MPKAKCNWEEIEERVLQSAAPLDYAAIARKENLPATTVRKYASRHGWRERHEEFLKGLKREADRRKFELLAEKQMKVSAGLMDLNLFLLSQLNLSAREIQRSNHPMNWREVYQFAKGVQMIQAIFETSRGDISRAVTTLVENGMIPEDKISAIFLAAKESEERLGETIAGIFEGSGAGRTQEAINVINDVKSLSLNQ